MKGLLNVMLITGIILIFIDIKFGEKEIEYRYLSRDMDQQMIDQSSNYDTILKPMFDSDNSTPWIQAYANEKLGNKPTKIIKNL
jgi:hypothetical protein